MAPDLNRRLIESCVAAIRDNADHLTALDQAIGDGDHGINMLRGFKAVEENLESLSPLPLADMLQKAGLQLVMKVGGASGPLYGTLFMAMGKSVEGEPAGLQDVADCLRDGVAAVKRRGKSDVGEKTMLDVLVPVAEELHGAAARGASVAEALASVKETAERELNDTRGRQATKGRASFLGERSIGHLDPGAASSCLLIRTICDNVEASP